MSKFEPHDYFMFNPIDYTSREIFKEHVSKTYEQIRELADYIEKYEGIIDTEFKKIVTHLNEQVNQMTVLYDELTLSETTRVNNEAERISKDSERDSKIEAIEEDVIVMATNLIENGDFSDGTTGWTLGNHFEITGERLEFKGEGTAAFNATPENVNLTLGDVYFLSYSVFSMDGTRGIRYGIGDFLNFGTHAHNGHYSFRQQAVNSSNFNLRVSLGGADCYFENIQLINLTKTFGAGNEPTAEQMDKLLEQFPNGWVDGTVNIYNSKHMLTMFFNELTKLNNVITT